MTQERALLDKWQKKLAELTIGEYEKTSTYRRENTVTQTIRIRTDRIYPSYYDDMADVAGIAEFERSMRELAERTPFQIVYTDKKLRNEFAAMAIPADAVEPLLYELTGRKPRRDIHAAEIPLYEKFLAYAERNSLEPVAGFCTEQISRLKADKNSRYGDAAEDVLKLATLVCENREDILVRELSVRAFGYTKEMEQRSLLSRVLYILITYGKYDFTADDFDSGGTYEDAVLAEYHVYRNPVYVNFSGNAEIRFENGTLLHLKAGVPVALRSDRISVITSVHIDDSRYMTIENLTSYNRMVSAELKDTFLVYLAGYHNKVKQDFLVRVRDENPGIAEWLHFGDIDPDGFLILENLRDRTGIDFQPWHMGQAELDQYAKFCRKLNDNDRIKAEHLLQENKYTGVLTQMLNRDQKLEQEIISWQA